MMPDRLAAFLTSRRQLAGCGLALVAVGLTMMDPVGPAGLVLVGSFYLLGVAAARPHGSATPYGFDPKRIERSLRQEIAKVSEIVPTEIIVQLERIERILRTQVLPRLDCLPPASLDLFFVERIAVDYLPRALENYLRLPVGYLSTQPGGERLSPAEVLSDEVGLLELEIRRIAAVVQRVDMDRMLAHRRFLSDRFGRLDASG